MAEGVFRLPGASYEDLKNIIVAYGTRDEAASPGDVRKLDAVHRTSANRTNGFLVDLGLLRGESERLVTPLGRQLARAYNAGERDEVRRLLTGIVSTSEFLQNVVSAVKIKHAKDGVDYESVQAYIAHAAGQPRNKPTLVGSATVIELLKDAGLLREGERGRVFARKETEEEPAPAEETPDGPAPDASEGNAETPLTDLLDGPQVGEATVRERDQRDGPVVNIHLHIDCLPDDLDDLVPRLKALISALRDDPATSAADLSLHLGDDRRFPG